VRPELIEVARAAATWQQPFDASLADVFQVQADIAGRVADALNVALGVEDKRSLAEKPTANLAAYDAFLKGEAQSAGMSTQNPPDVRRAIGFYRQATALDSAFVPAWAQLARAYAVLYRAGVPSPEVAQQARLAEEDQLRDAPDDGQLNALLGHALALAGRKADAIRAGRRALTLLPSDKDAYFGPYIQHQLARIYLIVGEPDLALDQLEPLLRMPYTLTPGWLRVDPLFDPVRTHPRFERLIAAR
jgi:non-specific serine/threonine protein kinase